MKQLFIGICCLLFLNLALCAEELALVGTTDKEEALYLSGEKMVFSVRLLEGEKPVVGKKLEWKRTGDDGQTESGKEVSSEATPLMINTSLSQPGFVRIEVWVVDDQGKALVDSKNQPIRFDGGAGVEVEKLESIPEPADFDAFWDKQKARLAAVPLKFTLTEVPSKKSEFLTYDVKVDCVGGKQVSGYLTKPVNAAPKSLMGRISFMGYGVTSAPMEYNNSSLTFSINAHGIENGKDAQYYKKLSEGELKGYAFKNSENANPETAYFNGMILRVLRALEFLKAQPEWNGRDIFAAGGSQGGFQAIAAAAFDKDVTNCWVNVPWCCDLGGITLGRKRGWRPDYVDGLGYYDTANMGKRVKCPINIVAGLGDSVCPPSGVCVLYNNIKAPKSLSLLQGKTHMLTPKNPQKIVLKNK